MVSLELLTCAHEYFLTAVARKLVRWKFGPSTTISTNQGITHRLKFQSWFCNFVEIFIEALNFCRTGFQADRCMKVDSCAYLVEILSLSVWK